MSNNSLLKNDCINIIKPDNLSIHSLINYVYKSEESSNLCSTLPYVSKNVINFFNDENNTTNNNIEIKLDIDLNSESTNKLPSNVPDLLDPVLNFSFPINNNNFIEIVFNITSINKLSEWFDYYDLSDRDTVDLVLDLFWLNNTTINENIDQFILLNQKIIKIIFNNEITINESTKIVNKLIKNNYGKRIKYLDKIKKYLTKYI